MNNPYEAPQAPLVDSASAVFTPRSFGGIQRMPFVGVLVALIVIPVVIELMAPPSGYMQTILHVISWVFLFGYLAAIVLRLKNIGMSGGWALLLLVPIANLLLILRCLAFQEGYVEVGKLDTPGRVMMYLLLALLLLSVVGIVFVSI